MRERRRIARTFAAVSLAATLAGCANRPVNDPLRELDSYSPAQDHYAGRGDHTLALVLAFSGGGTRAAAFSYGVLEELRRTALPGAPPHRMLDEVDVIEGVSGGSFTALAYALYGERLFDEYEGRFLKRDVQGHLIGSVLNPVNWPKLLSPAYGRSELAAEYYDEILFEHATFADILGKPDAPVVHVSATDITTGGRFVFAKGLFDLICSDLRTFPLSRAAAASSAVPVVLSAVALDNRAGTCGVQVSERLQRFTGGDVAALPGRAKGHVQEMMRFQDRAARPYIHLVDGGVSDNLGLRGIVESMNLVEINPTYRELVGINRLRRLAIIIVNSRADPPRDWDRSESGPGIVDQLVKASGVPIDRYSYDQIELVNDMVDRWALLRDRSRLAGLEGWPADPSLTELPKIEFYPIDVSFERIADAGRRQRFMSLPTSFVLSPADVDALREVAGELLRENAAYRKLVQDLGGSLPR